MERKPACPKSQRTRQADRYTKEGFEARSFNQTAEAPVYKGTAKGTHQGHTSYIPYRRSARPDVAEDIPRPQRLRITKEPHPSHTRDRITEDIPVDTPYRSPWKQYLVIGAVIVCVMLFTYTTWIAPWVQGIIDQWHYGDARISYITVTINGVSRDVLGIGYKGAVEIVILPDPKNPQTHATMYILPDPMGDKKSRVVTPHAAYVNNDTYEDIVVEIEGSAIAPVLYGLPDGSFQWTIPPKG